VNYAKTFYLHDLTQGLETDLIYTDLDWQFVVDEPFSTMQRFSSDLVFYSNPHGFADFGCFYAHMTPGVRRAFALMHEAHVKQLLWDQELFTMVFASAVVAKQVTVCHIPRSQNKKFVKDIGRVPISGMKRRLSSMSDSAPGIVKFGFLSNITLERAIHDNTSRCGVQQVRSAPLKNKEARLPETCESYKPAEAGSKPAEAGSSLSSSSSALFAHATAPFWCYVLMATISFLLAAA
jgi:hypothetical protein